jgi:hypothetical protein
LSQKFFVFCVSLMASLPASCNEDPDAAIIWAPKLPTTYAVIKLFLLCKVVHFDDRPPKLIEVLDSF